MLNGVQEMMTMDTILMMVVAVMVMGTNPRISKRVKRVCLYKEEGIIYEEMVVTMCAAAILLLLYNNFFKVGFMLLFHSLDRSGLLSWWRLLVVVSVRVLMPLLFALGLMQ